MKNYLYDTSRYRPQISRNFSEMFSSSTLRISVVKRVSTHVCRKLYLLSLVFDRWIHFSKENERCRSTPGENESSPLTYHWLTSTEKQWKLNSTIIFQKHKRIFGIYDKFFRTLKLFAFYPPKSLDTSLRYDFYLIYFQYLLLLLNTECASVGSFHIPIFIHCISWRNITKLFPPLKFYSKKLITDITFGFKQIELTIESWAKKMKFELYEHLYDMSLMLE